MRKAEKRKALIASALPGNTERSPALLKGARSAKQFLESMRYAMNPDEIGPALAESFRRALAEADVQMVRTLLPYVLGNPTVSEPRESESLSALMSIMAEDGSKGSSRSRLTIEMQKENYHEGEFGEGSGSDGNSGEWIDGTAE